MSTAYEWPRDMTREVERSPDENWMEDTLRSVTDSVEEYARREPLKFAAWVFGIGFFMGWRMKPW